MRYFDIILKRIARCTKLPSMRGPGERFIIHSFTFLCKRLFLWFKPMTSRSHNSNFTVATRLPFVMILYYLFIIYYVLTNMTFWWNIICILVIKSMTCYLIYEIFLFMTSITTLIETSTTHFNTNPNNYLKPHQGFHCNLKVVKREQGYITSLSLLFKH